MNQLSLRNVTVDAHVSSDRPKLVSADAQPALVVLVGRYLEVLLLGGKGIFVWGIFARLPHLGFFL